jgi:unsaturated chondroitin disaccharide hydrolase
MAKSHAYKTIENHIRDDGGSYQVVKYDALTGEVIEKWTVEGYSVNSTWARGQAWGIYGFTMCYRETGDIEFLNTAVKMADYFIDHLPVDFIPYWDLDLPVENTKYYRDASAAAIALSALLELSDYVLNSSKYSEAANKIINSLVKKYLSIGTNSSGILLHCAYNVNSTNPYDWDASTIWGDYYFLEALKRYNQPIVFRQ